MLKFSLHVLIYIYYPLIFFFNFNIWNSGYPPRSIVPKLLRFGHLQQFISSKFFDISIRKSKSPRRNEGNGFSVNTLNVKKSNTLSLIHLEENATPLLFQKLKLNNHNLDYIM